MPNPDEKDIVDETAAVVERLRAAYTSWNNPPSDGLPEGAEVVLEAADLLEHLSRERGTVPEGWVLVPKEPADEMMVEAAEYLTEAGFLNPMKHAHAVHRIMLSAAPQPPSVSSEIERLRAELEKAREALNHLVYRNKDDGSWRCAFYGDQNITKWVNDAMLSASPVPQNGEG